MIHSLTSPSGGRLPWSALSVLLIALLATTVLYHYFRDASPLVFAQSTMPSGLGFSYQLTDTEARISARKKPMH